MLKKAGYKNMGGGHGVYQHPGTGHKLHMYTYRNGRQNWQAWIEAGRLPPPPKVVANAKGKWWQIKVMEGENGRFIDFGHFPQRMTPEEAGEMAKAILSLIDSEGGNV